MTLVSQALTCGDLYRTFEEACASWPCLQPTNIPHGHIRLADRAVGHMRGQAEKVYLGACKAFMIRPAADWFQWAIDAMTMVCIHYHLHLAIDTTHGEIWGCKDTATYQTLRTLQTHVEVNSAHWHGIRARLCGVETVDMYYHERHGYGQRCEPT